MREILFKAKRTDNGEWVEGFYFRTEAMAEGHKDYIIPKGSRFPTSYGVEGGWVTQEKFIEIDKDTICQYTGLTDKNGNKIWENDVVKFKHEKFDFDDGLEPLERTCLPNKKEYERNYSVEFCNTSTHYGLRFRNGSIWFMVHKMTVVMHDTEVIGNIFDNPKLLPMKN